MNRKSLQPGVSTFAKQYTQSAVGLRLQSYEPEDFQSCSILKRNTKAAYENAQVK